MALRETLIKFIEDNVLGESHPLKIKPDTNLIEEGLIDSMGLIQLLLFVEKQTGIHIPDEQVLPEHFQTVLCIERLVEVLQTRDR
jgi:acyl carrier protein